MRAFVAFHTLAAVTRSPSVRIEYDALHRSRLRDWRRRCRWCTAPAHSGTIRKVAIDSAKIRVIQDVEEFSSRLECDAFMKLEILYNGNIPVDVGRAANDISTHVPEAASIRRCENRRSLDVASIILQLINVGMSDARGISGCRNTVIVGEGAVVEIWIGEFFDQ